MQETNEPKPNTWKQPLKGRRWLAGWMVLIACLALVARFVLGLVNDQFSRADPVVLWSMSIGIALAMATLIGLLFRCLSTGRNFKRLLFVLACLTGLIVLFYAEEDIHGRLAWGQFKAQWEAKGEKFEVAAFVPPSVPDDRNFAMTP